MSDLPPAGLVERLAAELSMALEMYATPAEMSSDAWHDAIGALVEVRE